jgi:hypothetical protein
MLTLAFNVTAMFETFKPCSLIHWFPIDSIAEVNGEVIVKIGANLAHIGYRDKRYLNMNPQRVWEVP